MRSVLLLAAFLTVVGCAENETEGTEPVTMEEECVLPTEAPPAPESPHAIQWATVAGRGGCPTVLSQSGGFAVGLSPLNNWRVYHQAFTPETRLALSAFNSSAIPVQTVAGDGFVDVITMKADAWDPWGAFTVHLFEQ